jgi:hypothetical protein
MLTLDPGNRITIEQIKSHEFFRADLPPVYIVPRPITFRNLSEPLDASTIGPEILNEIRKIGYQDADELTRDLAATGHSMAKVFYFMHTGRLGLEGLDWTQSESTDASIICRDAPKSFGLNVSDPFHRYVGASPDTLSSSSGPLSYAVRPEWAELTDSREVRASWETLCGGRSLIEVILAVQILVRQSGMEWLHPDDFTVVARNETAGLYVLLQASFVAGGEVRLAIEQCMGTGEAFRAFCTAAEEEFGLGGF